jgi:hypothetical protein
VSQICGSIPGELNMPTPQSSKPDALSAEIPHTTVPRLRMFGLIALWVGRSGNPAAIV